jgi:hypothetical protein
MDADERPLSLSPATRTVRSYHVRFEDHVERAIRMALSGITLALGETVRVLRIMVSLHSAEDFTSVLKLYGLESPPNSD